MKILIIDDHAVVRAGICLLVRGNIGNIVCDEASGCCDALRKVQTNAYDVALIGLSLPDLTGYDVVEHIKRIRPNMPLVVFSMHSEEQYAIKAYTLGADGYISEENIPEELFTAMERVLQGRKYVSAHLVDALVLGLRNSNSHKQSKHQTKSLSRQEQKVAELLVSGDSNKEIAWKLNINVKTVSTYKARILTKLKLKNLTELVKHHLSRA